MRHACASEAVVPASMYPSYHSFVLVMVSRPAAMGRAFVIKFRDAV